MLLRSDRDRAWTEEEVCAALRCPPSWARKQLDAMAAAGLVEKAGDGWRYDPASGDLEHAAHSLDEAYRHRSREVVRFVFAAPRRRR